MMFSDLGLAEGLARAVAEKGYTTPTPIQARAIPEILAGHDLLAAAQTGTGKTAAFTLPLLQNLSTEAPSNRRRVRALVLVPTRELATQVHESVTGYGRRTHGLSAVKIFGGVSFNPQVDGLRRGAQIVVATPGRLLEHAQCNTIDLSQVEILVLDEADRMLDMGFIHDIRRILKLLPAKRQNLMFSATFSGEIRKLAHGILQNPTTIDIAPRNSAVETVTQRMVRVAKHDKTGLLSHLVRKGEWKQTLVFTRTKHGADKLARKLANDGITTDALHGNKSQNARTRALDNFKAGRTRVLVATDIAARGLDISELPHVVNYDLPNVPEDYVHRIGRTGRAGRGGEALSLVGQEEGKELKAIERLLSKSIESIVVDDFVATPRPANAPSDTRPRPPRSARGNQPGSNNGRSKRGGPPRRRGSGSGNRQRSAAR